MLEKFKDSNYIFYLVGVSLYCLGLLVFTNGYGIYLSIIGLFFIAISIALLFKQNPEPSEILNRITYLVIFSILLFAINHFITKIAESLAAARTNS